MEGKFWGFFSVFLLSRKSEKNLFCSVEGKNSVLESKTINC